MPHHIFIAAMPKSASTFVARALSLATGFNQVQLVPEYGRRQPELCEIRLAENAGNDFVAKHHTRHSSWTEQVCNEYGVSTIVLVRSLFDIVVSLRDHVHRESPVNAMFYLEKQHVNRSDAELERMITMLAIPWYINFYMGWRNCRTARLFTYEDIVADPKRAIGEMLEFSGVAVRKEQVVSAVGGAREGGTRINVGKPGRGRGLQRETVAAIMEMLSMYPEIQGDDYVLMMKRQATDILSAPVDEAAEPARFSSPALKGRPASRPPLRQRVERFIQRKSRLLGSRRDKALSMGLLFAGAVYFSFLYNLIPNNIPGGRIDDFLVPAICAFIAGRMLARVKVKRVPLHAAR